MEQQLTPEEMIAIIAHRNRMIEKQKERQARYYQRHSEERKQYAKGYYQRRKEERGKEVSEQVVA